MAEPISVSVIIDNYNYAPFLSSAIDSVLCQATPGTEVVVVDDGSTDTSRDTLRGYGDQIVAICKENEGQASALNAGLENSSGDVVFFLDADDLFLPGKIERILVTFRREPAAGWVFHDLIRTDRPPEGVDRSIGRSGEREAYIDDRARVRRGGCPTFPLPPTSALCFRRELLRQIFPIPNELRITADEFVKLAAVALSPGVYVGERLGIQRLHAFNAYTGRRNLEALRAKIGIRTALHLRRRFPEMHLLTDRIFASGLGRLMGHEGPVAGIADPDVQAYACQFIGCWRGVRQAPRVSLNYLRAWAARLGVLRPPGM